jgi:hypothetical protein
MKINENQGSNEQRATLKNGSPPNGGVYEGETRNGKPHGKGKYTYANGDIYEGDFAYNKYSHEGEPHGKGKMTFTNGDIYEGDFFDSRITGKGKYTYTDGSFYEGEVAGGTFNGRGRKTHADGTFIEGIWDDDQFIG